MNTFKDISISRKSTAEQVADGLADKIMRGELSPGEPIRESVLATNLGISRNTVRESMRLLEQSSLITYEFNRGAVVKKPSSAEVWELYQARRLLEAAAVQTSTPDPLMIAHLEQSFEALSKAARGGNPTEIVACDLAFHAALVGLAGSTRINEYFADLVQEMKFYLMVLSIGEREYEQPESVIEEHRVILKAVKAGDMEQAKHLVTEHIDGNRHRVDKVLKLMEL